jgi:trimeric autotransporter adhesin
MNSLRKAAGLLCVSMLAAVALFSNAAFGGDKAFTLNMAVSPPALSPASVTAKFTNQGNSSFNSLTLDAPAGIEIVGTPTATRGVASIVTTGSGNRVQVLNINLPAGSGQFVTLTLTARRTSTTCGATTGNWTGQPWTGSGLTGNTFGLVSPSTVSTTISVGCMSFSSQPADALTNAVITSTNYNNPAGNPVQVSLTPVPVAGTSVSLASSCTSGGLALGSTNAATTSANGVAIFSSLASSSIGSGCTLTATATGFQSATSNAFRVASPSLAFGIQPNTTLSGALITSTPYNNPAGSFVSVKLLLDGSLTSSFDGTTVTIDTMGGSCVDPSSGVSATVVGGVATFSQLKTLMSSPSSCTLTASVLTIYPQFGSVSSNSFSVTPSNGTLVCQGQQGTSTFKDGPGTIAGNRGASNKDGSTCVAVVYGVTGLVSNTDKVVSLKWDTALQPYAAFSYMVTWNPTPVDPTTGMPPTSRRTKVAWDVDAMNNPQYVYGVGCLSPNLPASYGTVTASVGQSDTTISASLAGTPSSLPFPIVIGTERMSVTGVSGSTFTVSRGDGGTGATSHPAGAAVMSTPLPIDNNPTMAPPNASTPNPYLGKQAHMCIQFEGFMTVSPGFVQFKTNIFDIGDGLVSFDE